MNRINIMQRALGEQWDQLPVVLQAHYQETDNVDIGTLDIEYPAWMQLFLNLLYLLGALLNRRGSSLKTEVAKKMYGEIQHWARTVTLDDGRIIQFHSRWHYAGDNRLIEYVNPLLGLCMSVKVDNGNLVYSGEYFVLRIWKMTLPIPEWILLGHTTIIESRKNEQDFVMDFRLTHPLFGQVYRYSGTFTTKSV